VKWLKEKVGNVERLGFILKDGSHIEVENMADDPQVGGLMSSDDLMKHFDNVKASWHTHTGTANLSESDYTSFLSYPDWDHYIAGTDGIIKYSIKEGNLVQENL